MWEPLELFSVPIQTDVDFLQAHELPPEELERREVVHINIAADNEYLHAGDIQPATCPSKFISEKTGRYVNIVQAYVLIS